MVVAALHAAEAEDEDDSDRRCVMKTNQIIRSKRNISMSTWLRGFRLFIILTFVTAAAALSQVKMPALQAGQQSFTTAQDAAAALLAAAEKADDNALLQIFGPNSYDLIHTGDASQDKDTLTQFLSLAREKMAISNDPRNRSRSVMLLGNDEWPFAVPLAKVGGKWFFDTDGGRQEVLYRRIGRNELDAIQICRGFVEAENDYSQTKHDNALVNQYAQKIISSPGKHDGLAWQNADGSWDGVVGEKAAKAIESTYTGKPAAFHGYYFKVLKGQGPAAPKGALDYMINGAMIGGFALIAYPAVYQGTGVKTFMVSNDGVVWEKDMGPNTLQLAGDVEKFNPDKTWSPVLDDK